VNGGSNLIDSDFIFTYLFDPLIPNEAPNENTRPMPQEEILRTTRTFSYIRDSLPEDKRICPIGMDTFQHGDILCEMLGCSHIFRRPAIMNWLRRSSQCPVCRYNIRTYQDETPATVEETLAPEDNNVVDTTTMEDHTVVVDAAADDSNLSDIDVDLSVD
jgi:hypothetical protein